MRLMGLPSSVKNGLLTTSLLDVGLMTSCLESFLPDDVLISKVQKVVFENNIISNLEVTDKTMDAIDQDLIKLNSSLVISPSANSFELLSDKS